MIDIATKQTILKDLRPFAYFLTRTMFCPETRRDVVQTLLLKAWENLLDFQENDEQKAKGFAKHVMRQRWKDFRWDLIRQRKNELDALLPMARKVARKTLRRGNQQDFLREFHDILETLPDPMDQDICHLVMAGHKQADIAKVFGVSRAAINLRLKNLQKNFYFFA